MTTDTVIAAGNIVNSANNIKNLVVVVSIILLAAGGAGWALYTSLKHGFSITKIAMVAVGVVVAAMVIGGVGSLISIGKNSGGEVTGVSTNNSGNYN